MIKMFRVFLRQWLALNISNFTIRKMFPRPPPIWFIPLCGSNRVMQEKFYLDVNNFSDYQLVEPLTSFATYEKEMLPNWFHIFAQNAFKCIRWDCKRHFKGPHWRGACQIHNFCHVTEDGWNAYTFFTQKRSQRFLTAEARAVSYFQNINLV